MTLKMKKIKKNKNEIKDEIKDTLFDNPTPQFIREVITFTKDKDSEFVKEMYNCIKRKTQVMYNL